MCDLKDRRLETLSHGLRLRGRVRGNQARWAGWDVRSVFSDDAQRGGGQRDPCDVRLAALLHGLWSRRGGSSAMCGTERVKCHALVEEVTHDLEAYQLGEAGRKIYDFLWDDYADWYIEVSKTRLYEDSGGPWPPPHRRSG